jgi:hypothetical protein
LIPPDPAKKWQIPPPLTTNSDYSQIADHLAKLDAIAAELNLKLAGVARSIPVSFPLAAALQARLLATNMAKTAAFGAVFTESGAA